MMGLVHLTVIGAETIVCIIKGVNYILVPLYLHEIRKGCGVLDNYKLQEPKALNEGVHPDLKPYINVRSLLDDTQGALLSQGNIALHVP